MMSINILNMRGSFNGVWGAEMSKISNEQMRNTVLDKFCIEYRYGKDPNELMSFIIDKYGYADKFTEEDYNYINREASNRLQRIQGEYW